MSEDKMESSFVDEREDVQKKTFTKWINSQLVKNDKPLVEDLFLDLRDGEILLSLLEILTAQQYKRERGRMRVHHINNVNTALQVLDTNGVKLVNISSNDVVDGNPKLILGLVWSIILHWQVHYHLRELMADLQQTNLEKTLLAWCRTHTQNYSGVNVKNFTSSWSDGLAFNALLHRWRPQLFDYTTIVGRSPAARLEHAFALAQHHLGIDRLLDPEDVNTPNPDKKSIMMYVMCLFQSLPHASEDFADLDSLPSEPTTPLASPPHEVPTSRPLSTATTGSGELGGYYSAFEEVLAWLLEAEERLAETKVPDNDDLAQLKEHFHSHERFLLELSEQQMRVGAVLEEGARLVLEGGLERDEAAEVRLQVRLLNQRWERLRAHAMDAQAHVHSALMKAQLKRLEHFRQWLTKTEDRISRMGALRGGASSVGAQLHAVSALHDDLAKQQPLVDALADCVIVVDDDSADNSVTEIEDQLSALSERWSHTCQWTMQQLARLRALHDRWTALDTQHAQLLQACDAQETELKQMEANPASEIGEVLGRIGELQRIKHSISVQQQMATAHLDTTARLCAECGDADTALVERAEALHDRLDALLMILDVQATRIRDLGFEFDINTQTEESKEASAMEVEGTRTITTTMTVGTSEERPNTSKKPRLADNQAHADFQVGYRVFENWARDAEKVLDDCKKELERKGGNRREIPATLERIEKEIEVQRADFANVEEIQRRLAGEAGLQEEAKLHAQSIDELKKRWETIQRTLLDIRNTMNLLEDKENFYKNIEAFTKQLDEIHAWKDRMLAEKPTNNQLIHLRNKIRAVKHLEMKLKELNAQSIILLTKPISKSHKDDIESDTKRTNEAYEQLLLHLTKREVEIKLAITKPREHHEDQFKNLQAKIQSMESRIISEHAMISSRDKMESKIEELGRLKTEFEDLQTTYDNVVKERREKYEKGSVQELNFRSSLENLVTRFGDTKAILEQKITKLKEGLKLVQQLEEEAHEVKRWLGESEKFVADNSCIPVGELEQLDKLLDASNKLDEAKSEYKSKLDSIEAAKEKILEDCDEALAKQIKANTMELRKRYDVVTDKSFKLNESLRRALERTEAVFRKIEETYQWLQEIEGQIPKEEECRITDSAELYQVKARFQTLKDKCDDKTQEFRNLNEAGNDILLQAEARPPALLAKRVTHLNARWNEVTHGVYERYKVLAEAWHETGELRGWLTQEGAWLDGLQRRLRRSPDAPADAEEIADELYDLENYIQNHSDERLSRIQDIGRQLIDAHIMSGWIQAEIDNVTDRWNHLRAEAASRSALLERLAREAAQSEVSVDNLQQWLDDVAFRLDADRPQLSLEDHQRLSEEFEKQRAVMKEVEQQVEAYQAAGKHEAANRLRDQLRLVQRKFTSAEERLQQLSSRPEGSQVLSSDICARLTAATNALQAVHRDCTKSLPLAGAEPDTVRAQLRTCLRFYRTLSEIKSEVESIIKTGRKMVEEKTVSEPQEFSKKIDNLKELYNKLGAQITESKTKLENALLTAREIQNDVQSLSTWLDGLGTNIGKQTLELEMSRMEAIKDKLNGNYAEFAKNCDPAYLENLKSQIEAINRRWDHLKRHGIVKRGHDIEALHKYLDDIERELDSTETMSAAKLRLLDTEVHAKAAEVDELDNKALTTQYQKIIDKISAAALAGTPARSPALAEYENVTDTIKRRLESPVNTPETEKPEFKRSKIPLALKSPVPIRREIKEGGNRSRGSSLERGRRSESTISDSLNSAMSTDSMERSLSNMSSVPSTPETPKKDSSTFNLLKDSELFTQISKNTIQPKSTGAETPKQKADPCHMVAVKEHEIMKSTVHPVEPMEIYPFEAIDAVVEFIPQNVETVEIIDDTENESVSESESEGARDDNGAKRPSVDLGSEPRTFVVEVKTLEHRMKPTLGILKRKMSSEREGHKTMKVTMDVPDLIPAAEKQSEHDVSMRTPPPTPLDEDAQECPLLYDLAVRQKEAVMNLRRDEVNEYLILDEVPKDQAAMPEPSITEEIATEKPTDEKAVGENKEDAEEPAVGVSGDTPENILRPEATTCEEVIYSEVEDPQQSRLAPENEFHSKQPLSTSTPIKADEKTKKQVQVVAMSPKLGRQDSEERAEDSKKKSPSPVVRSGNEPKSPLLGAKSHIPISKERLKSVHSEKYQRTDDSAKAPSSRAEGQPSPSSVGPKGSLAARFGAQGDEALAQFEAAADTMSRRMDVMLLTVGGVDSERDPGKRLEILKNQLGQVAPDAAALISRGDSLVYDKHKDNPLLADYIQTHFQDKLRNKWSLVMSEIETKRNQAIKAEDDIKELNKLIEELQKWLKEFEVKAKVEDPDATKEILDREADIERVQELCKDLKAQHVGYPEKAVGDVLAAWTKAKEMHDAASPAKRDKKAKVDGVEVRVGEFVTRANRARSAVASVHSVLRSAPLSGKDYDEFPLQEDAIARVKSSIAELQTTIEDTEKEFSWVEKRARPEQAEQSRRVRDKLHDEWNTLNVAFKERQERWSKCQSVWASLYSVLESLGEWLDGAERALEAAQQPQLPFKDLKQKVRDIEKQMASRQREVGVARGCGRSVVVACGAPLARDVQDQLDLLNERWHAAAATLHNIKERISAEEASAVVREGGAQWAMGARAALAQVSDLLDTTSPNPSDRTSLSIRLSLVKAREEELATKLKDMEVLRKSKQLPRGEAAAHLGAQLEKAQASLSAHRELLSSKLCALGKYSARLDGVVGWAMEARTRLNIARDLAPPQADQVLRNIATCVKDRESEVREVLENYNNIERECVAAKQTVSPEVREKVLKLKEDWAFVRSRCEPDDTRTAVAKVRHDSEDTRSSVVKVRNVGAEDSRSRASPLASDGSSGREGRKGSDVSEGDERKGSVDSQTSDWSGRASGRRRSSQQSPAALLAHFDTTVLQIRDWVSVEVDMLRAQPVAVGDVDDILSQLDKQKGVLRELEQKKPQLDELLHTAESLKGTENRQQLHGKAPQGNVPEKIQEFNRRASQDVTDAKPRMEKKESQNVTEKEKPKEEKPKESFRQNPDSKNPFSPHYYRNSRPQGHFEMGPRGLDFSPHRMGLEFSNRLRDYAPHRSTSIHGHELTDGPVKPEYLGHRAHFGSQIVPGGMNHPDVVFRHDYYNQMGFSPPRASRFSSQEYLNAPAQYGRWPDYRQEYRQRRRSQQDLHSLGQSGEPVTALREHWDEANARVLQRKAQLDAMLGDSQRYEARRRDADAWLSRMEARLAAMPPPGHTADVLEMQLREQKSFHAEVHQYKHQIELFGQLTQRLIAVYRNDDTSSIKRSTEAINHRYNELNNSIIARGKALHSAVSSLQNFDRSLEKFVAWLSEAESLLDAAERDPHLLKVSAVILNK